MAQDPKPAGPSSDVGSRLPGSLARRSGEPPFPSIADDAPTPAPAG